MKRIEKLQKDYTARIHPVVLDLGARILRCRGFWNEAHDEAMSELMSYAWYRFAKKSGRWESAEALVVYCTRAVVSRQPFVARRRVGGGGCVMERTRKNPFARKQFDFVAKALVATS